MSRTSKSASQRGSLWRAGTCREPWTAILVPILLTIAGCADDGPAATVEGTLLLRDKPLEQCLITFLPEPGQGESGRSSAAITDQQGRYQLQLDNQQPGASVGWHRVLVHDLLVSTGVRRRDHGTVDLDEAEVEPPPPKRDSRVPADYTAAEHTPWRKEVKAGHQVIDLEIP